MKLQVVIFVVVLYSNTVYINIIIYTIILLKSVGVRKRQIAILVRSSRDMSLTVRIVGKHILSGVRVSVRPSNFLYAKNTQNLG